MEAVVVGIWSVGGGLKKFEDGDGGLDENSTLTKLGCSLGFAPKDDNQNSTKLAPR
jgi:hypothetical protein